jgi:ferritin-like metal-binding protein YciE
MILIVPSAGGFCAIAGSTPGGQMTPRDSASLSLRLAPLSVPGVFCRVSGGQFRSGAACFGCPGCAAALEIDAAAISVKSASRMMLSLSPPLTGNAGHPGPFPARDRRILPELPGICLVECTGGARPPAKRFFRAGSARLPPPTLQKRSTRKDQPMGLFSKDIKTMDDLFVHTLRDIYYAENQIVKALPDMIEKASDPQLKQAFQAHLGETKNHVKRVEQVFQMHGVDVKGVDCPAIDGIIEEAEEVAGEVDDKQVLDAALIAAAQAVEHYEMTRYGTLVAWAKQLGRNDCAAVLQKNLDEEKGADKKLNDIAERSVNRKAA